jgi:hypothetical protein
LNEVKIATQLSYASAMPIGVLAEITTKPSRNAASQIRHNGYLQSIFFSVVSAVSLI